MNGSFSQPKSPDSWWFDYFLMVALSKNHWFICQNQQNYSINLRFCVSVGNQLARTSLAAQRTRMKLAQMNVDAGPIRIIVDSSLAINYRLHILKSHSCPGPQITFFPGVIDFLRWKKSFSWLKLASISHVDHRPQIMGTLCWPPSMHGSDHSGTQEAQIRIIWRLSRCNELAAGPKWMLSRPTRLSALLLTI